MIMSANLDASSAIAALTMGKLSVDDFLSLASRQAFPCAEWGNFFAPLGAANFAKFCSLQQQITADNAARAAKVPEPLKLKVSEKGTLSIYGLQKFPVSLYPNQWERIFAEIDTIREFIEQHKSEFASK